jgi:hypothetical protein
MSSFCDGKNGVLLTNLFFLTWIRLNDLFPLRNIYDYIVLGLFQTNLISLLAFWQLGPGQDLPD